MSVAAIIPARYASTRFPGKPLANQTGKPLIQHVCEAVQAARRVDRVVVATDDERIVEAVRRFGGVAVMTRADHPSGTDRVAEVARGIDAELIVNVQGDEPEMDPGAIDALVDLMEARPNAPMGSLACRFEREADVLNPACVKVVLDRDGNALYFSRSVIPYPRDTKGRVDRLADWLLHLGVYAYRREFLFELTATAPAVIEQAERLEQLRALHMGAKITMAVVEHTSTGIDTPEQYAAFVERYCGNKLPQSSVDNTSQSSVDNTSQSSNSQGPRQCIDVNSQGPRQFIDATPHDAKKDAEKGPWRVQKHTPPHLLLDETWYMISASTYQKTAYFANAEVAEAVCEAIERECRRFGWGLKQYVVMPDHYHFVARSGRGRDLPAMIKRIHGCLAAIIRKCVPASLTERDQPSSKQASGQRTRFFNNYWDTCLNSESQWLSALEYMRTNPVSAGLVNDPEDWKLWGPRCTKGLRQ